MMPCHVIRCEVKVKCLLIMENANYSNSSVINTILQPYTIIDGHCQIIYTDQKFNLRVGKIGNFKSEN